MSEILPTVGKGVCLNGRMLNVKEELYDGPFSKVFSVTESSVQYALKIERSDAPIR